MRLPTPWGVLIVSLAPLRLGWEGRPSKRWVCVVCGRRQRLVESRFGVCACGGYLRLIDD